MEADITVEMFIIIHKECCHIKLLNIQLEVGKNSTIYIKAVKKIPQIKMFSILVSM
jgi:hypothetical protein